MSVRTEMKLIKPSSDTGQPSLAKSEEDQNHDGTRNVSPTPTLDQASIDKVAWEPATKKLSLEERLNRLSKYRVLPTKIGGLEKPSGRGGKAAVVQASFNRSEGEPIELVAVKKLLCSETADQEKFSKEFVHEVELLARLSHENIVRLIGFVEDFKQQKAWIVLSWAPNGNVREFIASGHWEIPERISLLKDLFEGLKYIHTRQPPICHGDLKSLNILVSSSYHAIITDFGSSRIMKDKPELEDDQNNQFLGGPAQPKADDDRVRDSATRVSTMDQSSIHPTVTIIATANQLTLSGPAWSLRWAAPEVVKEEEPQGLPSDIWSAGWVCWEIMTNKLPFPDVYAEGPLMLKVLQGKVPVVHNDRQLSHILRLWSLMKDCWAFDPKDRPNVVQCWDQIRWMPAVPPLGGEPSGPKNSSVELSIQVGHVHYSQGGYDDATSAFQRALSLARSAGDQDGVAEALTWLGHVYRAQSKLDRAAECYTYARDIYVRIGSDFGQANMLRTLAVVHDLQSQYDQAEENFIRARDAFTRIGHDLCLAKTFRGMAHLYQRQSKYDQAEEWYKRAYDMHARIGDSLGRSITLTGLGDLHLARAQYTTAEQSYVQAQDIYARMGNDVGRAHTLIGLGQVYSIQARYTHAEESYTQANGIYSRVGDLLGQANTLAGLAHLRQRQGGRVEAEALHSEARDLYSQIGEHDGGGDRLGSPSAVSKEQDLSVAPRLVAGYLGNS